MCELWFLNGLLASEDMYFSLQLDFVQPVLGGEGLTTCFDEITGQIDSLRTWSSVSSSQVLRPRKWVVASACKRFTNRYVFGLNDLGAETPSTHRRRWKCANCLAALPFGLVLPNVKGFASKPAAVALRHFVSQSSACSPNKDGPGRANCNEGTDIYAPRNDEELPMLNADCPLGEVGCLCKEDRSCVEGHYCPEGGDICINEKYRYIPPAPVPMGFIDNARGFLEDNTGLDITMIIVIAAGVCFFCAAIVAIACTSRFPRARAVRADGARSSCGAKAQSEEACAQRVESERLSDRRRRRRGNVGIGCWRSGRCSGNVSFFLLAATWLSERVLASGSLFSGDMDNMMSARHDDQLPGNTQR